MAFDRVDRQSKKNWLRRLPVVFMLLIFLGMMAGLGQPAAARPQDDRVAAPSMKVTINEVAWGGTGANTSHKWIELHNELPPGSDDIDLKGWKINLMAERGGPVVASIDLSPEAAPKKIKAGDYFLIENNDSAVSDITADLVPISGFDLNVNGMVMELRDNKDVLIDSANRDGGGWPAGKSNPSFCSMERVPRQPDAPGAWHDNNNVKKNGLDAGQQPICGTPKYSNSTSPFTPTPTVTSTATVTGVPTGTGTPTVTRTPTVSRTPTASHEPYPKLSVVINEVGWMGTYLVDDDEWVELYNPGKTAINLAGWKLQTKTGPFVVKLTGIIPADGYFLLESGDDHVISDIKADQIYDSSQLSNLGESLQLIDSRGTVVDTANKQASIWPAGSVYPYYCSMERAGAGIKFPDRPGYWITNDYVKSHIYGLNRYGRLICGSPKHRNWAYSVTVTPSLTPTKTNTPWQPYRTPTKTATPKKSPTPTRNPNAVPSSIIINEFLAQPRSDWNGDGKIDTGDEFIEIVNLSNQPLLLSGWSLDDQAGDSNPYYFEYIFIEAKAHLAFFSSETGILLSTGGDSVRLFKANGLISDAFTYGVIRNPDQSWCRLPDGNNIWVFGCVPTIASANKKAQSVIVGNRVESAICLSQTLPQGVQRAECDAPGLSAWDSDLWEPRPAFPRYLDAGSDIYILD